MDREGPPLEAVLRRVSEVPEDFLAEPQVGTSGRVVVAAVVHDVAERLLIPLSAADLGRFSGQDPKRDGPRLAMTLLLSWAVSDDWVQAARPSAAAFIELLGNTATQLAQHATAEKYVRDPDRREELARLVLAGFGLRPAGETRAQAQDRLTSISTVERNRVLKASRAAEERARAIREALARKAAEESADKWTRE